MSWNKKGNWNKIDIQILKNSILSYTLLLIIFGPHMFLLVLRNLIFLSWYLRNYQTEIINFNPIRKINKPLDGAAKIKMSNVIKL